MQSYNVNHITSSPHYSQSNGLAEKYVQIGKSLFYKVKEEGKDFYKMFDDILQYPSYRYYEITCGDSPRPEC